MLFNSAEEIRDDLRSMEPLQWCVVLETAEYYLNEYGFDSLAEFVTAPYSKGGLGIPLEKARHLLFFNPSYQHKAEKLCRKMGIAERAKEVDELGEHGGDRQVDKTRNINLNQGGTASKYRIAKLKRDHPEIAKRLEQGEYATVREAERDAGIVPPKRRLQRFSIDLDDLEGSVERFNALIDSLRERQ